MVSRERYGKWVHVLYQLRNDLPCHSKLVLQLLILDTDIVGIQLSC